MKSQDRKSLREWAEYVSNLESELQESRDNESVLTRKIQEQQEQILSLELKSQLPALDNTEIIGEFNSPKIEYGATVYSIGILNLERRFEEAKFDAISYFDKKCPYCSGDLYSGHIRHKIEVDHFFPIAKGGQNVPWNIIPICKKCNRLKRDKMPYDYLGLDIYEKVKNYLLGVREKYVDSNCSDLQNLEMIIKYLSDNSETLGQNKDLLPLFEIANIDYDFQEESQTEQNTPDESKFEKLKRYLTTISQSQKETYSGFNARGTRLYINFNESYEVFLAHNRNKDIPKKEIRKIFKENIPSLLEFSSVVSVRGKSKRCIIIDFKNSPEPYKSIFSLFAG